MRRVFRGIELRDWPTCIRTRLTLCRRDGHLLGLIDPTYCANCAAPWFFTVVTSPPPRPNKRLPW